MVWRASCGYESGESTKFDATIGFFLLLIFFLFLWGGGVLGGTMKSTNFMVWRAWHGYECGESTKFHAKPGFFLFFFFFFSPFFFLGNGKSLQRWVYASFSLDKPGNFITTHRSANFICNLNYIHSLVLFSCMPVTN